jgi:hypothetical protein
LHQFSKQVKGSTETSWMIASSVSQRAPFLGKKADGFHQSRLTLKADMSAGLHFVHSDFGTRCSAQQSAVLSLSAVADGALLAAASAELR